MPDEQYEAASELLRVLSAPIRLAIITRLAQGPATVTALTADVGHSQPLVSQHLRLLRSVRLVHAVPDGRERIYELVDEHVAHIVADAVRHTAEPEPHPAKDHPDGGANQRPSTERGSIARRGPSTRTSTKGTS